DNDSTYLLCPSAYIVSNAKEDFPEPDSPVITTNLFFGISTSTFFKLWAPAPRIVIFLVAIDLYSSLKRYFHNENFDAYSTFNSKKISRNSVVRSKSNYYAAICISSTICLIYSFFYFFISFQFVASFSFSFYVYFYSS